MVSAVNAAQFSLEYSHIMKNFNDKNNNYLNYFNYSKDLKKYKSDQSKFKENSNYLIKVSIFS